VAAAQLDPEAQLAHRLLAPATPQALRDTVTYTPPEILSQEQLRQRIREVIAQHPDGREILHRPETRLRLRVTDIAHYTGSDAPALYRWARDGTYRLSGKLQRKLSWFFAAWDSGRLVKELVGVTDDRRLGGAIRGRGVIVRRDPKATRIQPPPTPDRVLHIELTPQGPKLRVGP
jgi:hypothetical protein